MCWISPGLALCGCYGCCHHGYSQMFTLRTQIQLAVVGRRMIIDAPSLLMRWFASATQSCLHVLANRMESLDAGWNLTNQKIFWREICLQLKGILASSPNIFNWKSDLTCLDSTSHFSWENVSPSKLWKSSTLTSLNYSSHGDKPSAACHIASLSCESTD